MVFITNALRGTQLMDKLKTIFPAAISSFGLLIALSVSVSAEPITQTTVTENDVQDISLAASGTPGWYKTLSGTGAFTTANTVPYNVAGSARLSVGDAASYAELGLYNKLPSLRFDEISLLSYETFQNANNFNAISLQLGVDLDLTDTDTSWQGRMIYEPSNNRSYANGPVTDGIWQGWPTFKPTAKWWMTWSSDATARYGTNPCPQSSPCSLADIKTAFPNAGLNAGYGNPLILKAGSGWSAFTGYADVPSVTTASGSDYYDFEPTPTTPNLPTSKEQCFKAGWQTFGPVFKNQGQCVAAIVGNKVK